MPPNGLVSFSVPTPPNPDPTKIASVCRLVPTRHGSIYYFAWSAYDYTALEPTTPPPTIYVPEDIPAGWIVAADFSTTSPTFLSMIKFVFPTTYGATFQGFNWHAASSNGLLWVAGAIPFTFFSVFPNTEYVHLFAVDPFSGALVYYIDLVGTGASGNGLLLLSTFEDGGVPYVSAATFLNQFTTPTATAILVNANTGSVVSSVTVSLPWLIRDSVSDGIGFYYVVDVHTFAPDCTAANLYKIDVLTGTVVAILPLTIPSGSPFGMIINRSNGQIMIAFGAGSAAGAGAIGRITVVDTITMTEIAFYPGLGGSWGVPFFAEDRGHFSQPHHDSVNGKAVDCPRGEFTIAALESSGQFEGSIQRIGLQLSSPNLILIDTVQATSIISTPDGPEPGGPDEWGFTPTSSRIWNPFWEGFVSVSEDGTGACELYTPYTTGSCGLNPCTGVTTEFR